MPRYRSLNQEIKRLFNQRIDRVTVNGGFTCPNIDGTKAKGGCTFCQDASYEGLTLVKQSSVSDQIIKGMAYLKERNKTQSYFVYFQNGTNTYAPLERLKSLYHEALAFPQVKGLFIATRPDCLASDIIEFLAELNKKTYLWVELGLSSHRNDRNDFLNRAHTVEECVDAAKNLNAHGINTCIHIMNGLPGETHDEIIEKAHFLNDLPIQGVKIHNLVVFKKTVMEKQFREGKFTLQSQEEYVNQTVDFLENLRPDIIVHRLNAHGPRRLTVAPEWSINKWETINGIHTEMERRNCLQGFKL